MKKIFNVIHPSQQAVTIVEVLVAIAVIGTTMLMSATFIKYHGPSIQLHQAAGKIRSHLQEARALSLTYQQDHGIVFTEASNTYALVQLQPSVITLKTIALPEEVSYNIIGPFTNDTVRFNTSGAASQAGTVGLINSQGATKTVTINPSGFIGIE